MVWSESNPLPDDVREAIEALSPEQFDMILPAFTAYVRAEMVISRHAARHGHIPSLSTIEERADVSRKTAIAAARMARNTSRYHLGVKGENYKVVHSLH